MQISAASDEGLGEAGASAPADGAEGSTGDWYLPYPASDEGLSAADAGDGIDGTDEADQLAKMEVDTARQSKQLLGDISRGCRQVRGGPATVTFPVRVSRGRSSLSCQQGHFSAGNHLHRETQIKLLQFGVYECLDGVSGGARRLARYPFACANSSRITPVSTLSHLRPGAEICCYKKKVWAW